MADTAAQTQYRQEFIATFEEGQSWLRSTCVTEAVIKGQTSSGSFKPAMLSNGVRTMVPTHITTGTKIVVLTEDGSYVERAKD